MFSSEVGALSKRDRTRERIREIALRSFREHGYEGTTIRRIADEAGLSVGATHYHFPSKQHLVQEMYVDVQLSHRAAAEPLLADVRDLTDRLGIVMRTGIAQLEPYRAHAAEFLAAAVSPRSPINPLAPDSAHALDIVEGLFREAIAGSATSVPSDLREILPRMLTLGHLLLALFWTYDSSPGGARTERLLAAGLQLLRPALPLLRIPMFRKPLGRILDIIGTVGA